jgi:hypothetical protein
MLILIDDYVMVDTIDTGDAEDDYYCGMYNGKKGYVTALKPNDVVEVAIKGVERPCYFYTYELTKIKRPTKPTQPVKTTVKGKGRGKATK